MRVEEVGLATGLGGGGSGGPAFGEVFQLATAFGEGFVEEERVATVEQVENDEDGGDIAEHFGWDAFAAEALGERGEGERSLGGGVPGEDFAIEDGGFSDGGEGCDEVGEGFAEVVAIAGVEGDARAVDVELGADAVEFVFELGGAEG
jgi:hypothetical protein